MKSNLCLVLLFLMIAPLKTLVANATENFKLCEFEHNGFKYRIDPRMELWNVMSAVLGNSNILPKRLAYKEEVLTKLSI